MKSSGLVMVVLVLCLLVALVSYGAGRSGASGESVLRADKLELMSGGKVAATLRADKTGLDIRGPDGKLRAQVGFIPDQWAGLTLFDETGHGRIALRMLPFGQADIYLSNEGNSGCLSLIAPPTGGPGLSLRSGEKGKYVALDDEGQLVCSMGCGVKAHVLAPASPAVCE